MIEHFFKKIQMEKLNYEETMQCLNDLKEEKKMKKREKGR